MLKWIIHNAILFSFCCLSMGALACGNDSTVPRTHALPAVLPANEQGRIAQLLLAAAHELYNRHIPLPANRKDWEAYSAELRKKISASTGMLVQHQLPLRYKEMIVQKQQGYTAKNICFQTRIGVSATAGLFVPDGKGPFPAVMVLCGHSPNGRFYDKYQAVAQALARHGYVALLMDPWGAGERTTVYGQMEYHGGNLGASLMDAGETLMGMQLTDNIRGIDLLCSLPYVDTARIGATGASGGGNQTMWLAAMDTRVKAAVPVVSVGTFESYILRSNCICELLPGGLRFTEEAGVLALIAPRAVKMCNAALDINPAFYPEAMQRSYQAALPVFTMMGKEHDISYEVFDLPHGYFSAEIAAMLGWMNHFLKGEKDCQAVPLQATDTLPEPIVMSFAKQRPEDIVTTAAFCSAKAKDYYNQLQAATTVDTAVKRKQLKEILHIQSLPLVQRVQQLPAIHGWNRYVLHVADNREIPLLLAPPADTAKGYVLLCHPAGKQAIPTAILDAYLHEGYGLALADIWGTGELALRDSSDKKIAQYHTLARSVLWLGQTMMGEWVKDLFAVSGFLKEQCQAKKLVIDGTKETGLAALFMQAIQPVAHELVLRYTPVSYGFDQRAGIDFFSMAVHLPGMLPWGDVSLAAALSHTAIRFIQPVTMSGRVIDQAEKEVQLAAFRKQGWATGNKTAILMQAE